MQIRISHVTLLAALACGPAHATLGGDAASIAADQAAWQAALTQTAANGYTDYRLALPDGLVVHEYLGNGGKVFQVSWGGKGHKPDMVQLLGRYEPRIAAAARGVRPMQRRADAVAPDLEMHATVVNRYFSGTAHLPQERPASLARPVPLDTK